MKKSVTTLCAVLLILFSLAITLPACSSSAPMPEACTQPPESGRCRAAITRWWYDGKAGTCRAFTWGGCDGSAPFETLEACHTQCMAGHPVPENGSGKTVRPAAPAAQTPSMGTAP